MPREALLEIRILESFNALTYKEVTNTSPHLETLFVKITKGNKTINASVVYRPPNSCFQEFLLEFEKVIKALTKNTNIHYYILNEIVHCNILIERVK